MRPPPISSRCQSVGAEIGRRACCRLWTVCNCKATFTATQQRDQRSQGFTDRLNSSISETMDLLRMCLAALAIALVAGQQHRVAIVGGGVGGASAAHYLKQHMMSAVDIHV